MLPNMQYDDASEAEAGPATAAAAAEHCYLVQ